MMLRGASGAFDGLALAGKTFDCQSRLSRAGDPPALAS
jgi:hypothetical protein